MAPVALRLAARAGAARPAVAASPLPGMKRSVPAAGLPTPAQPLAVRAGLAPPPQSGRGSRASPHDWHCPPHVGTHIEVFWSGNKGAAADGWYRGVVVEVMAGIGERTRHRVKYEDGACPYQDLSEVEWRELEDALQQSKTKRQSHVSSSTPLTREAPAVADAAGVAPLGAREAMHWRGARARPGELVWAKLAGHRWWPARVEDVDTDTARVYFFGTHNYASVPRHRCLALYAERREEWGETAGRKSFGGTSGTDFGKPVRQARREYTQSAARHAARNAAMPASQGQRSLFDKSVAEADAAQRALEATGPTAEAAGSAACAEAPAEAPAKARARAPAKAPVASASKPIGATAANASAARAAAGPAENAAGARFAAGPGAAAYAPAGRDGSSDVRALLDDLGIGQYADALDEAGYDDVDFILQTSAEGIRVLGEDVGMKPGHVHKLNLRRATWKGVATRA